MLTYLRTTAEVWIQRAGKPPKGPSKSWRKATEGKHLLSSCTCYTYAWGRVTLIPMVDAVGAQIPFIWQLHLAPTSVSVRQLPLYPEICPWSVGNHFLEMPGILCPSRQWPTAHHWLIQSTKGCPPGFEEGIPWYNSCSRAVCGIRLRLDFSWTLTLWLPLSFPLLPDFLILREIERSPSVICSAVRLRLCF